MNFEHVVGRLDGWHRTEIPLTAHPEKEIWRVAERWSNGALPEQVVITSAPSKRQSLDLSD